MEKSFMKKLLCAAALGVACAGFAAGVSCRVEPDYAVREAGKPGEAYVKVTLAAERVAAKNRPSVNLAIVLDRSGSMHGDKIAKAREAACEAIERLDERDVVSVVAYDDTVETIIPAQRVAEKPALLAKIRAIEPGGSTALFAGVSEGAKELRKFRSECEISRVLLLSDGQANVGPSSADELGRYGAMLMKEGVSVSTVGLGAYYNEDLMTRLSQKSDGNSYFVENSDDLARIFATELGDVLSVAATRVRLSIRFCDGFIPVALIGRDGRIADGTATLDLNQLYGAQEKYALVKCDVAPGRAGEVRQIAHAYISYIDPSDGMGYCVLAFGSVSFSDDPAKVKASVNRDVVRERVRNENALRTEEALRLADSGDFGRAQQMLIRNSISARRVNLDLGGDKVLADEETMQADLARSFTGKLYTRGLRKKAKTDAYQLVNQQKVVLAPAKAVGAVSADKAVHAGASADEEEADADDKKTDAGEGKKD